MRLFPGTLNPEQKQGRRQASHQQWPAREVRRAAPQELRGHPASCPLVPGCFHPSCYPVVSPTPSLQAPLFVEVSPVSLLLRVAQDPCGPGRRDQAEPGQLCLDPAAPAASPHLGQQLETAPSLSTRAVRGNPVWFDRQ